MFDRRFWQIWEDMNRRCYSSKDIHYYQYGARGITVCDRWQKYHNFYDDMYTSYLEHYNANGGNTTIERINVNEPYDPSNCTWVTKEEQAGNKQSTIWVRGTETEPFISLKGYCTQHDLNYKTMYARYKRNSSLFDLQVKEA
ncbi:hypothetical protein [Anaerovibrio lipolyticus]|uniref:hypothetical protein n=1 Tax=Anaerovibrio lipolyticus TaxID=82374 RepID=UPI0006872D8E|nr:hypothetical protein [Anaerovibrio lipolyticus]